LINLIGSIKDKYPDHPHIYVYDLGLFATFKKEISDIPGVSLLNIPHFAPFWRSCYTWKTYIFNNPLAELNLYLDAGNQATKTLEGLFDIIDKQGYLLVSAGDTVKNGDIIPREYVNIFKISDEYLDQGIVTAGIFGFKKDDPLITDFTKKLFDCGLAGLCLGFSKNEQWKNKGVNKNYFIRNAKYFRHDNTLFCALIEKMIPNAIIEPFANFYTDKKDDPKQYLWNLRLNFKRLDYVFVRQSKSPLIIRFINSTFIKSFLALKEINRIIKKNHYE